MKRILFYILILAGSLSAQTPYAFLTPPRVCFDDANGVPLAGGFLTTWAAGTSTQLATYHLDTLGNITPNTNPIILGSDGCAEVRLLPQSYKMQLTDATGSQIWQVDQISDVGQTVYSLAVLLNPPGAALQTVNGPLAATSMALGGAAPLATTAQSGTGNLCMTTNCSLVTPSVNGTNMPHSPGTYILVPNATVAGTTLNKLAKLTAATLPAWVKTNDQTGSGSGSPQVTAAFASPLSDPSLIIVLATGPVGTFNITDTAGNTYTDCGAGQLLFNTSGNAVQCFYAANSTTTASNVVSFASSGGGTMKVTATEFIGGALSSPVDVTQNSGNNASSGTGGGQNVSSGPATTTGADLVVGVTGVTAGTLTAGTGFSATSTASLEYLIQSTPAALSATWNDGTNNDSYAAMMVAFRPFSGALSAAVVSGTADTTGIQGIAVAGAGVVGSVVIQQSGESQCVFDGATTANDYVQNSSTFTGDCHDTGSANYPASGQVIGRVLSTNGAAGTYLTEILGPEIQNGGSSSSPAATIAVGAGAGATGSAVCVPGTTCLNAGGTVKVTTSGSPPSSGTIFTVKLGGTFHGASCTFSPVTGSAAGASATVWAIVTGTTLNFQTGAALAGTTQFQWAYACSFN